MKLTNLERVNHLVGELEDVKKLIEMAEQAEAISFQLFIEAPADASLKMSAEGASTTHFRGIDVSTGFLANLKRLAVKELQTRRQNILTALSELGVEAEG